MVIHKHVWLLDSSVT